MPDPTAADVMAAASPVADMLHATNEQLGRTDLDLLAHLAAEETLAGIGWPEGGDLEGEPDRDREIVYQLCRASAACAVARHTEALVMAATVGPLEVPA